MMKRILVGLGGTDYTVFAINQAVALAMAHDAEKQEFEQAADDGAAWPKSTLYFLGLLALVGGAHLMVLSATSLARAMGVSDLVIGLTIVAIGTSLPELATSVTATIRRQADISVGFACNARLGSARGRVGHARPTSWSCRRSVAVNWVWGLPVEQGRLRRRTYHA